MPAYICNVILADEDVCPDAANSAGSTGNYASEFEIISGFDGGVAMKVTANSGDAAADAAEANATAIFGDLGWCVDDVMEVV